MSYGFTCKWCRADFEAATDEHKAASKLAHEAGWCMTMGPEDAWGGFAHITCPNCVTETEKRIPLWP